MYRESHMQSRTKIFDRLAMVVAVAGAVFLALLVLYPGVVVLLVPGVHSRSPFCSKWQAMRDHRIKLRQAADAKAIAGASHLVRRESGLALWATPQGEYWIPASDDKVLPILLAQEKRDIYGGKDWGVRAGDVVLDCGAYVGTWARQALDRGAKLVVEIEPSPDSVECIRRNLAKEIAGGRVVIVAKGVWDSEGALKFFVNPDNTAGNSFVESESSGAAASSIPVTTVDKLASELRLSRVDFIKADIKGALERLLRGGKGVIVRDRPRLAFSTEEIDDPGRVAALAKTMQPGYEMKCGPCFLSGTDIITDVLFFR